MRSRPSRFRRWQRAFTASRIQTSGRVSVRTISRVDCEAIAQCSRRQARFPAPTRVAGACPTGICSCTFARQERGVTGRKEVRMGRVSDAERPRVSVVIPALNEARNIGHVLATLPADTFEVVLVDGGSTDGTVEVARSVMPGLRVVQQTGTGKGDALAAGVRACSGDAIVLIDADGSTDGSEIPRFVDAL